MQLTRLERWILSNQFKILERLIPDEADYYRKSREAIDRGYAREYDRLIQNIYPEKDCLSEDECREVFDILVMFCDLKEAHDALENGGNIEGWYVEFSGFDGNNEVTRLSYCEYLCDDSRNNRFQRLHRGDDFNSHMPTLDNYRRMLEAWRPIAQRALGRRLLTKDEVIAITSARPHPDSEIGEAMREPGRRH